MKTFSSVNKQKTIYTHINLIIFNLHRFMYLFDKNEKQWS